AWAAVFSAWLPLALVITKYLGDLVPTLPGTDVPLIGIKPGDAGVHLAGAAAFVLLRLHQRGDDPHRRRGARWLFWACWLTSLLFVTALNRGGFLSVLVALGLVSVF